MGYYLIKLIKTTFIILVLLLILFGVSSIHAENTTDIPTVDVQNMTDTNFIDFQEQIDTAQNGDTINLTHGYKYNSSVDKKRVNGNDISKDLTVVGHGNVYIDGDNVARGLYIGHNCNVVLKNIVFKNCFSKIGGAAISVSSNSNLTVINCTFLNNKVYNAVGGAISAQSDTNINVNKCVFSKNTAVRESDIEWSKFKVGMGSAICVSVKSTLKIINSVFNNNNAYLSTILLISYNDVKYDPSRLYVDKCLFENNTSHGSGVIYLDELGKGEIKNSVFRNNKVTADGGTVVLDACFSALVKNCLFEGNSAVKGGAIQIKVFDYDYRSYVTIENCNFTKNMASYQGGAVYAKYGVTKLVNCNFNENYCPKGGAIYTKYASIELKDSTFNKNSANYGGALFLRTDNNYIINNIFKNNQASIKGGAIFSKVDKVSSNYCKYVNNKAPISSNVYGVFKVSIEKFNKYWSDVKLKIKISSPWKMPLSQSIKITFDGPKKYTTKWLKTNSHGILDIKVPLKIGKYTLSFSFKNGISHSKPKITVVKAPCKISAKKVTAHYKSGKMFKIHVKNAKTNVNVKNAKLKLKIYTDDNFDVHVLESDKHGSIKFDASKLSVGNHIVEITKYNDNIKLSKFESSIKVKKASAIVKSPKKIKKSSKLKVTVLNKASKKPIKKTKFKVHVNGKTSKVKTNSKGVLKINTKKLSKGKHKILINLQNSKYKINKKVKIKVR